MIVDQRLVERADAVIVVTDNVVHIVKSRSGEAESLPGRSGLAVIVRGDGRTRVVGPFSARGRAS